MWLVLKNGTGYTFLFLIGVTFVEQVVGGAIYKGGGDSIENRENLRECGGMAGSRWPNCRGEGICRGQSTQDRVCCHSENCCMGGKHRDTTEA